MKLADKSRSKLKKLIALLGSDKDGEVVATVRAIERTLKSNNCDFHDLAKLEGGSQHIVYQEKIVYRDRVVYQDRVVEKVVYRDRPGPTGTVDKFHSGGYVNGPGPGSAKAGYEAYAASSGIADWKKQAQYCYQHDKKNNSLRSNEKEFISDMYYRAVDDGYPISDKQENWLRSIYRKLHK